MSSVLGVIIAGGRSSRFGTDKAQAAWQGRALLDHAVAILGQQVDELVLAGRVHPGLATLADRPPGVGPIGGLAAAIHHAAAHGHAGALCVPVDVHPLPETLREQLVGATAAVFADQHMVGWWPSALVPVIDSFIAGGGRSLLGLIEQCGARRVADPPGLVNVNRPSDLARLR